MEKNGKNRSQIRFDGVIPCFDVQALGTKQESTDIYGFMSNIWDQDAGPSYVPVCLRRLTETSHHRSLASCIKDPRPRSRFTQRPFQIQVMVVAVKRQDNVIKRIEITNNNKK